MLMCNGTRLYNVVIVIGIGIVVIIPLMISIYKCDTDSNSNSHCKRNSVSFCYGYTYTQHLSLQSRPILQQFKYTTSIRTTRSTHFPSHYYSSTAASSSLLQPSSSSSKSDNCPVLGITQLYTSTRNTNCDTNQIHSKVHLKHICNSTNNNNKLYNNILPIVSSNQKQQQQQQQQSLNLSLLFLLLRRLIQQSFAIGTAVVITTTFFTGTIHNMMIQQQQSDSSISLITFIAPPAYANTFSYTVPPTSIEFLSLSLSSNTLLLSSISDTTPVNSNGNGIIATSVPGQGQVQQQQQHVQVQVQQQVQQPKNRRIGGLVSKIRSITIIMDELQRDLMQERWDLVGYYPTQLRSYVPIFTTYTDTAFPSDAPTDKGLRIALRYEVGRFYASVERFKQASVRQSLQESYIAYSEMSLHLDRYLRVGGLYTYYDDTISNEPYYQNIADDAIIYANIKIDPPYVRDLIVLIAGPDKGKTGIVIGQYDDGTNKSIIKLDRYKGMREIRVVSNTWIAKRLGEQSPDDVFLLPRTSSKPSTIIPSSTTTTTK